ncbi:MAG: hypothetical protein ACI9W2_004912, partial [Gammaproteobacteria bacterium]
DEKISPRYAQEHHGVVISERGELDINATQTLRNEPPSTAH